MNMKPVVGWSREVEQKRKPDNPAKWAMFSRLLLLPCVGTFPSVFLASHIPVFIRKPQL